MRSWRIGPATEFRVAIGVSLLLALVATYLFGPVTGLGTLVGAVVFVYQPIIGVAVFWTAVAATVGLSGSAEPASARWLVAHWTPVPVLWTFGMALIAGAWFLRGASGRRRSIIGLGVLALIGMYLFLWQLSCMDCGAGQWLQPAVLLMTGVLALVLVGLAVGIRYLYRVIHQ